MNMDFLRKLPTPKEIKELYPLNEELVIKKQKNDKLIKDIIDGTSDKFLLIIGPCSADREDAVIDYIKRLEEVQKEVEDEIVIIPRVFTNKPRTTGEGYKGMLHQPNPLEKPDILKGVILTRDLHKKVLEETMFSSSDEMLYPENHRYLSDVLSYTSVGARSVEDQQHRLTASGLDIPVGMKNPTSGDLNIMMNSIHAAQQAYTFIYRGWEVVSHGNPYAHAVLRGYTDKFGVNHSNYHYEDLETVVNLYKKANLKNPAVIVDTNHANSNKDYLKQIEIAKDVLNSTSKNKEIFKLVKGLMIESYLEDGCQDEEGTVYGKSITDPCLGWDKTKKLILDIRDIRKEIKKHF